MAKPAREDPPAQEFASVWTRPQKRRRDQPALSREQIVAEALTLLDSEGIEALSMRKLGTRLNAGATSMYSHVTNKEELIELVVDEVYGEIEVPPATGREDWRPAAERCARSLREAILRHPWIASVLGEVGMAYLGPNMMRLSDAALGIFEAAGFDDLAEADTLMSTVFSYVIGTTITEAAFLTTLARSGKGEQEWVEEIWPAAVAAAQPYPRLRKRYAALQHVEADRERGSAFDVGLACVLDGVEARIRTAS
ncbi:TetR/AcrR family transcriptional regulator C-terminal domain-containing protein [Streptomyces sp. NPDC004609]|uniref:TetR/AcrR family transcriptional regulator C-terminal domain-containing protein n=1 Tax=Streptomyces sp. NPDC004609 TaxID=3364704 RepID=UPI0036746B0E